MLHLFLPRSTRFAFRAFSHGIEQSIRSMRGRPRPVFNALHDERELARMAEQARRTTQTSDALPWLLPIVQTKSTANGIVVWLERPPALEFEAGQFLTLAVTIDGRQHRRQYSIFTDPTDRDVLGIAIRRVPDGLVSNHLADTISERERISAGGPSGRFTLETSRGEGPVVLIAGGVGVTPLLSLAAAAHTAGRDVTLICANRGVRSIMLREQTDALAALSGVRVQHVLERRAASLPCPAGRLSAELLSELLPLDTSSDYFVCGPGPMMDSVCEVLSRAAIPDEQVHTERFVVARTESGANPAQTHAVRFARSGRLVNIAEGETILEGARAAGINLAFSCTMGGCAACKVRVQGDVHLPDPNCLTSEEAEAGETLACIACPRSSLTIDA